MVALRFPWGHSRWAEQASALVDGELPPSALERFERHRASCSRCQQTVEELREAKLLVSRLPTVASPRSFRLTPEMVSGQPRTRQVPAARPQFVLRVAQAGAALAVVAFVAITVADLSHGGSSASDTSASLSAPEANSAGAQAATARDSAKTTDGVASSATTTPGVVPPSGGGVGGQATLCGPGSSPISPGQPAATGPAAPAACPSPAPQPQAPAAGDAATPVSGASSDATGPGDQTFAANGFAPENAHSAPAADTGGDDWYRPAEFGTAAAATLLAFIAVAIVVRRRRHA